MRTSTARQLLPLYLIIFIDGLGYFIAIPILLRLLDADNLLLASELSAVSRNTLFGLALAVMPLAAILSRPFIGYLSDRFGRKKILQYCLAGSAASFLLPVAGIMLNSFIFIILGRFINGITASSQAIAQAAIADLTAEHRKAFYLSLNALCMTVAMAVGAALGGLLSDSTLVSWFNNTTPFLVATCLVIFAYGVLSQLWPVPTDPISAPSRQDTLNNRLSFRASLLQLLIQPRIASTRLLLSLFFLLELSWSLYYQAAPLILSTYYQVSTTRVGLFMGYAGLWMCLGLAAVYGNLLRFFTLPTLLISCMGLATVGTWLSGYLPAFQGHWYTVIPLVLGVGMSYPTLLTLLSNNTDPKQQGSLMGLAGALLALAWLITGASAGFIANLSPLLPFVFSSWIMLTGFILTWRWYYKKEGVLRADKR